MSVSHRRGPAREEGKKKHKERESKKKKSEKYPESRDRAS